MSKHEEPVIVGMKNDEGKQRWDLLPWESISELVAVLTFGTRKYAPNNWRRVHDAQARYTAALFRHVTSWLMGERNDPESGLHHLGHAMCNLSFLLAIDLSGGEVWAIDPKQRWACPRCAKDVESWEVRFKDVCSFTNGIPLKLPTCPTCGGDLDPKPREERSNGSEERTDLPND